MKEKQPHACQRHQASAASEEKHALSLGLTREVAGAGLTLPACNALKGPKETKAVSWPPCNTSSKGGIQGTPQTPPYPRHTHIPCVLLSSSASSPQPPPEEEGAHQPTQSPQPERPPLHSPGVTSILMAKQSFLARQRLLSRRWTGGRGSSVEADRWPLAAPGRKGRSSQPPPCLTGTHIPCLAQQ
uniref:Uncharacterized protein n=1 Tax=Sphaerodactylus townsendi TaxID=933632 RepID=A0ACB8EAY9_9SAUR